MKTEISSTISIVIPAKGDCKYLSETLQSIHNSELLPLEVLVIDDGITHIAKEIINSYSNILPISLLKNSGEGLVAALNTGIKSAKGEFLARIDNDDLLLPQRLQIQMDFLKANPDVAAVGSNCIYIDEKSNEVGKSNYPLGDITKLKNFKFNCLIVHPSAMFRKEKALEVGGYRSVFKWNNTDIAEDFDFWLRLANTGKVINLRDYLIKYRQHSNQLSSKNIYGQIIGTSYISALNISPSKVYKTIEFRNFRSNDYRLLISTILKNTGFLVLSKLILQIIKVYLRKIISITKSI